MSSRTLPRHPFSSVPEYWYWVPNASGLSKEPLPWYFSFHCMPNISNKPLASSDSFPKQGSLSVQVARSAVSERHVLRHHEHQRSLAVPLSGEELPPLGAYRSPLKSRFDMFRRSTCMQCGPPHRLLATRHSPLYPRPPSPVAPPSTPALSPPGEEVLPLGENRPPLTSSARKLSKTGHFGRE